MAHVLMLLSNPFRPDPRAHKEAKSLIKAGYKVTILCWDRDLSSPESEIVDDISLKRFGPSSGYGSVMSMITELPRFWMKTIKHAKMHDYEIIHAHHGTIKVESEEGLGTIFVITLPALVSRVKGPVARVQD